LGNKEIFGDENGKISRDSGWSSHAPREELTPTFSIESTDSKRDQLMIQTDDREGLHGWWQKDLPVTGTKTLRFSVQCRIEGIPQPNTFVYPRLIWIDSNGKKVPWDTPAIGPYHPKGKPAESTPELPMEVEHLSGQTRYEGVYRVPVTARFVRVELHLLWAARAKVTWSEVIIEEVVPPTPRIVRLATVHLRPQGPTPDHNRQQCKPLIEEAARRKADLVVLPETLTQYGTGKTYAECAESIPGPSTEEFGRIAKLNDLYIVAGLVEREAHRIFNVAVLIGPDGSIVGKYRKICLPRGEVEAGISPGNAYPTFPTRFGKLGMMVCYDGFFPEVARQLAKNGAEVIAFPVAGCNPLLAAARACENQVIVVSSTYTGAEQNWMISGVFGHQGEILAQAKEFGTIAMAEIDLTWPSRWAGLGDFGAEWKRHQPPATDAWIGIGDHQTKNSQQPSEPTSKTTQRTRSALEPRDALKSFRVADGFELQLVACEPLVCDPVAIDFDESGRAYVAEMRDYPYTDPKNDLPFSESKNDLPLGRIRLLTDTDADGIYDQSSIFAEDLSWPSGIAVSRGGVFVAATPDIWYLRDNDGDGKADERQKVMTGFRKYNVQALMNNLKFGVDHKLYGAGSSNGGSISSPLDGENKPITLKTQDFRYEPRTAIFEPLPGGGRFGNTFNDWGDRFICNIRNPIRHIVVPDEWTLRIPRLIAPSLVHDVAASGDTIPVYRTSPAEEWRIENAQRLSQATDTPSPKSESIAAGYMTSASGLTIYRGSAYPPAMYGQAFLCESAGNLIHRQRMTPQGITFRSERIDVQSEFASSTDNWFRPVNLVNAPDGTLHVADMYRETIEHPWSMPEDIKAKMDLRNGMDRGRIYRIAPRGFRMPTIPNLARFTTPELVESLSHPDSWRRETAHRLIFERQDPSAIPSLRSLLCDHRAATLPDFPAMGRLLALWSLQGYGVLSVDDITIALRDPHPSIRRHALRLASLHGFALPVGIASDSDIGVRTEYAWALSSMQTPTRIEALESLCNHDLSDGWLRDAIATAAQGVELDFISRLAQKPISSENQVLLLQTLASEFAKGSNDEQVIRLLQTARQCHDFRSQNALLHGCGKGLLSRSPQRSFESLPLEAELRSWISSIIAQATKQLSDPQIPIPVRSTAIELLQHARFDEVRTILTEQLSIAHPTPLQVLAVRVLASFGEPEVTQELVKAYKRLGPEARTEVLVALSRSDRVPQLLDAMESDQIKFNDLPFAQRSQLLRSTNAGWKSRAVHLATQEKSSSRSEVIREMESTIQSLHGTVSRGAAVFERACSQCHRRNGIGIDLGPPLETIQHRSPGELLVAILDPSREVMPNYQEYAALLHSGTVITGVIAQESNDSITLTRAGSIPQRISRSEIETFINSERSIMPEGFEKTITPQEMADLIAFLRTP
jgi:putative membrane-bound dehydrogenase-like protein